MQFNRLWDSALVLGTVRRFHYGETFSGDRAIDKNFFFAKCIICDRSKIRPIESKFPMH